MQRKTGCGENGVSVVLKSFKVSQCKNMLSITTKNIVQSVWEEECNISHIFTVLLGQAFKNLKGYDLFKEIISLHIFKRLSSTNFTWSIFEYFVSFKCCCLVGSISPKNIKTLLDKNDRLHIVPAKMVPSLHVTSLHLNVLTKETKVKLCKKSNWSRVLETFLFSKWNIFSC